ncbi:MAG: acyl-CoA dehydrogenase family protein [Acidimicrobiales bacterium]
MATFEATRPAVGAMAIGIARAAWEYSRDYAKERKAFGKPIIENQAIAFMLADMITEIDAARPLVWRAAGPPATAPTSTPRAASPSSRPAARRVGHRALIQILGGYGYTGVPRGALAPRRQDHGHLRGHRADPAACHRPALSGMRIE